jgi:TRAP-type transport system small permease protein
MFGMRSIHYSRPISRVRPGVMEMFRKGREMKKAIRVLKKLTGLCDVMDKTIVSFTSALLFLMFILAVIAIFFRYVLQNPLVWSSDILVPSFVWVALLGISVAARSSSHVIIDSFIKILPEKKRKQIAVATQVVTACFCVFLVIVGFKVTLAAVDSRWGVLQLPSAYIYIAFPVSFLLIFFYVIDDIFRILKMNEK